MPRARETVPQQSDFTVSRARGTPLYREKPIPMSVVLSRAMERKHYGSGCLLRIDKDVTSGCCNGSHREEIPHLC